MKNKVAIAVALFVAGGSQAMADQQILDDLIVTQSLCVGQDCNNGESFGFDTLRLKENNLRIHFDDTSNSASFPQNDWRIVANDSSNGGQNRFSIEDATAGRTPFTIEAGAPNDSLYVEDDGDIGIGTRTPVVQVHVKDGNTPTLRLEQDGSSGFTPQTWDLASNEANFFIRDATNGSQLPFKIKPGADTGSLFIAADNDIGMGTESPSASLHVRRFNGTASILVEEASGTPGVRNLLVLKNNGGSYMSFENTSANTTWFFTHENSAPNRFLISRDANPVAMALTETGDMTIPGTLTTGGVTCGSGCDVVFSPGYHVPSIQDHAEAMWRNGYLPNIGPTVEGEPMNLTDKTGRMLNELEKAHIYIEQLHNRLSRLEAMLDDKN